MSLDKAIEHRKEHRKQYRRKAQRVDRTCRPHGSCRSCLSNRTHSNAVRLAAAQQQLKDFRSE